MHTQILTSFFAYFLCLIMIGIISHKKQTSNAEFIVGNRSLSFWLTALSAHASDMSAWLFMGLPMAIYLQGLSASWIAIGLMVGMFLNWQLVATKLRQSTETYDTYTLPSYFERRFSDHSGTIRILSALILIFFLTYYLSAGLTAMGILLETVFGINYYWGISFASLVVVAYTFGGGFVTIAWTDLFQALFLLFVIILVPLVAFFSLEHPFEAFYQLSSNNPGYINLTGNHSLSSIINTISLALSWGLGYFGMPHVITKFMGIRDISEMKKSKYVGMTWQFLALTASIAIGIVGALFFNETLDNPELVFVEMVKRLFHPYAIGFILCGILAANLSTMDSQLLVCASAIGEDLSKRFIGKDITPTHLVRASRIGVIIIASIALFIAFDRSQTILDMVFYAWAGLGASFGPLVLMSLYSKNANKYGAVAGILIGGITACVWPTLNPMITDYQISTMLIGFILGLLSIYFFSFVSANLKKVS